jgi:hypothetical protein
MPPPGAAVPILHVRAGESASDAQGRGPSRSAASALLEQGARVLVRFSLETDGVTRSMTGWALLDTGASATCIEEGVARELALPVGGTCPVTSATEASATRNTHPVLVEVLGTAVRMHVPEAISVPLGSHDLLGLIGRDVLGSCCLVYNGIPGEITLCS